MITKNQDVMKKIDQIAVHYNNNVANKYLRSAFYQLILDRVDWDNLEILTQKNDLYKHQGYHIDELYLKVLSLAKFVNQARKKILPNVRNYVTGSLRNPSPQDKIMAEMAGTNFGPNLTVLAEQLKDLYSLLAQEENAQGPHTVPSTKKYPELLEISELLKE